MMFNYPKKINHNDYLADDLNPKVLYGLPKNVVFCKTCAMSNQKPISTVEFKHLKHEKKHGINLNEDGQCDPCKVNKKKNEEIDWKIREEQLLELCAKNRKNDGSYDCLVPGSGGKDSFYASHVLKYKYKMNPLTVTWSPNIYTDWGWKNYMSWINSGQDNYLVNPNGKVKKLLTRIALENLLHPFQPFILGQRNVPAKIASKYGINLIFYGENEAEYNNPKEEFDSSERNKKTWINNENENDNLSISGVSLKDLQEKFDLSKNELSFYLPINNKEVEKNKIEVRYLGYYLKWDQQGKYYFAVEKGGFIPSPERTSGTYSKYNSIDDKLDDFHFYTTLIKFGVSRVNYDVSQELRNGEISFQEGKELVRKYQYEFPKRFENELYEYLSISEKDYPIASKMFEQPIMSRQYFDRLVDSFRSPHIWYHDGTSWKLRTTFY